MPNRIIKENICSSRDIDGLKAEEEVFYYRLWVNCDDYGRFDARIPMLKSRLYPLREKMKSSDIKRYLSTLINNGMVEIYTVRGIEYGQVKAWERHQQIRAKRSKYPGIDQADSVGNHMISNDSICPREYNPIQSKKESEAESHNNLKQENKNEISTGNLGDVFQIFKKCGFKEVEKDLDELKTLVGEYSAEWVTEAIKRANDRGKRSIGYVRGILQKWQAAGGIDDSQKPNKDNTPTEEQKQAAAEKRKQAEIEAETIIENERQQMREQKPEVTVNLSYDFLKKIPEG